MRIVKLTKETTENILENMLKRSPTQYGTYEASVQEIIENVKTRKDAAVFEYTEKFDHAVLDASTVEVTQEEIDEAYNIVDPELIGVIRRSMKNIREFHEKQKQNSWFTSTENGTMLGQKLTALHAQQALLQSQSASVTAQIASMEASMEEVLSRRQTLEEDMTAAKTRKEQIAAQQLTCKKSLEQAQDDAQSAKNTIAGYELRLKARQDKRDGLQKQLNAAGVQLDTLDSKIHMLREMEREYEGFSKAVRLVMQDAAAGKLRGIHGPVSKLIRVDDRYTTAIETALGAAMQNIVVSSEEDGKTAIQMLKRRDGGRATFLPLTTIKPQTLQDTVCQRQPGFLSIASGLVSCDEQYRAVIENALGRTVICDTLDNAVRMARACGSRVRIVTLDGQVMNAGGSMTGGSAAKSAGVLTRANTLAKLAEERKALTESAETLKAQTAEAASAAAKTEFELTAVRGQLREAEDEVLRRTEEHKQVQLLAAAVTENLENIEKELAHLTSRTGGEEGKLQTLKAQLQQQTSAQEALRAQETELTGRQTALTEQQQQLADKIGKKREYISTIERGNSDMQMSTFLQIASALGLRFSLVVG